MLGVVFMKWVGETIEHALGCQVIIDGKAMRAAAEKATNGNTPYIVSAYLADLGISIGQRRVLPCTHAKRMKNFPNPQLYAKISP
jgi:hypothetical protein